jgi:hypothetical protein
MSLLVLEVVPDPAPSHGSGHRTAIAMSRHVSIEAIHIVESGHAEAEKVLHCWRRRCSMKKG